jgi:hypothetical protein
MKEEVVQHTYPIYPEQREIEYFKIPASELQKDGFKVQVSPANMKEGRWVDNQFGMDDGQETVIINLPINSGKTTTLYRFVKRKMKDLDAYFFICSPYKKLVQKDVQHLQRELGNNRVLATAGLKVWIIA